MEEIKTIQDLKSVLNNNITISYHNINSKNVIINYKDFTITLLLPITKNDLINLLIVSK